MKKSKNFVAISFILTVLFPIIYICVYLIFGRLEINISHSYKQFLLENTIGPRLIIESGSSSGFAFDSYKLEKELNLQVINLADNAGYPLEQKLLRIEKNIHKDDILFLPLEWQYYSRNDVNQILGENILGDLSYYYSFNSIFDEIKLISNIPFIHTLKNIKRKITHINNQNDYFINHISQFQNHERGSLKTDKPFDPNIKATCNQYLFYEQIKNGFKLSEQFKQNMQLLKKIKKRNKYIYLVWPTVAGDACYSDEYLNKLNIFIKEIKDYLKANGIEILGNPFENRYLTKDLANTYYHINPNAMERRTENFIKTLEENKEINKYLSTKTKENYEKTISIFENKIFDLLQNIYPKELIKYDSKKVLYKGWSIIEKGFRWSLDYDSSIDFNISSNNINGILNLRIFTLDKQNIKIRINDNLIYDKMLDSKDANLKIKFNPKFLYTNNLNTISFEFPNAHAPNDIDSRKLSMAIKSFSFE